MAVKLILTGRRRTLIATGSMSMQAAFIRARYETSTPPYRMYQCGAASCSVGPRTANYGTVVLPSYGIAITLAGTNAAPLARVVFTGTGGTASPIDVPVNPVDPPVATGTIATASDTASIVTASATVTATLYLVEVEQIDTDYNSRMFMECLASDMTSTITATLTAGTGSRTLSTNLVGNDPTGASRITISVDQASYYALCAASAQRTNISDVVGGVSRTGYGPTYTLTATASVGNSAPGCDFAPPSTASKTATGCSAINGTSVASAPSDMTRATRATYQHRVHFPKTTFRVRAYNRSLNGTGLPTPYATTGTGFVGYRSNDTTGVFLRAFSKAQPLEQQVVFGGGTMIATAVNAVFAGDLSTGPSAGAGDTTTVYFPYSDNVAPAGVYYPGTFRPGVCVVNDSGFTADHVASGDSFRPDGTATVWRQSSNSLATCGIEITQGANVPIADYPFLSGGRFSGTWSATNSATIAEVSSSRLRIAATATDATIATLSFPSALFLGYRWLKARVRSGGSDPVPITVTAEDGTGTITTIVTASGSVESAGTDLWLDVLKSLRNIQVTANNTAPQAIIATYRRVTISVPAGKAIEIEYLRWERRDYTSASILLALGGTETDVNKFLPGFSGFTDGMPTKGVDRSAIQTNALLTSFPLKSAQTGWTGTYFGAVAQASTGQSDLLESKELNGIEPLLDVSVSTPTRFRGGRTCHGVLAYFGCGDVIGQGAYGDPTEVRYDTFVGSEMTATIINAKTPTLSTKKTSDGTLLSSRDFRTTLGSYGVLAPDILQTTGTTTSSSKTPSYIVRGGMGTVSSNTLLWNASATQTYRAWLGVFVAGGGKRIANIFHPSGWFARVTVASDGQSINFQRTETPYFTTSQLSAPVTISTSTGAAFAYPAISLEFTPIQKFRVRWEQETSDGYAVYESQSTDDGVTWSTPTVAIPGGRMPVLAESSDGTGFILEGGLVLDSAGAGVGVIKVSWIGRKVRLADGTTTADVLTVKKIVGGVESDLRITDGGFALRQAPHGQAQWYLSCFPEGEDTWVDFVSPDENTFRFTRVV